MTAERANPFDLEGFQPKPEAKAKPVRSEDIDKLADDSGFVSRTPRLPEAKSQPLEPRSQRRRRTGRNHQVNIRATAETLDFLTAISDALDEPFGEVLHRALLALDRELKHGSPDIPSR